MALTPNWFQNIRKILPSTDTLEQSEADDIVIEMADESADSPEVDDKGNILKIEHGDGSITISLDGSPLGSTDDKDPLEWFDNLVDDIDKDERSRISS